MTKATPQQWFIAHRCVDISPNFGAATLAEIIAASATLENTLDSMTKRFADGFGIETDLRADYRTDKGGILISHNPPEKGQDLPTLDAVLGLYTKANTGGCLALNIKDAGLQARLKPLLNQYGIQNYFTFDGANPDVLVDGKSGITAFGRESEIEPFYADHPKHPLANYPTIAGVWLDNFDPTFWITQDVVERHFANGKDVAIVSPELHPWPRNDKGAMLMSYWEKYRVTMRALAQKYPARRMMLCTKLPTLANQFFNQ